MNKINMNVAALAVALAFSAGAMAEGMSKTDYKAAKEKIAAEYKTAKTSCGSLSGMLPVFMLFVALALAIVFID